MFIQSILAPPPLVFSSCWLLCCELASCVWMIPCLTTLKLTPQFIGECQRCSSMHDGGRRAGFRRIGWKEWGAGAIRYSEAAGHCDAVVGSLIVASLVGSGVAARWQRRRRRIGWIGSVGSSIVGVRSISSIWYRWVDFYRSRQSVGQAAACRREAGSKEPLVVAFWNGLM